MMTPDAYRSALVDALAVYSESWPGELNIVREFSAFVSATEQCYHREHLAGHVTASAWVIAPSGLDVLLLHHAKLNKWMQPGGHADGNPNLLDVARQEVFEETALVGIDLVHDGIFDIDIHTIPERKDVREHLHYDVRFAFRSASTVIRGNHESHAIEWIPLKNLGTVTMEHSIHRMAQKWMRLYAGSNTESL
jgi:8-oxo-dGTP pyrophosphatase MutT (NUDIX family)